MYSDVGRNVGRQPPASESISASAPRELQPTPVVTQTSAMVIRSHRRESRSSAEKPKPEIARPEVVRQPEVVSRPAEIELSAPQHVCEEYVSARPEFQSISEVQEKPETVPTLGLPVLICQLSDGEVLIVHSM